MRIVVALLIALGTADAAQACGPAQRSIERNAQARVWVADGIVLGCHAEHPAPIRLGRRTRVREVRLAGHYAGVITGDLLVVHDLRRGKIERMRRLRGRLVRWILDRNGVAAYALRRASGTAVIGSSIDGTVALAARIDPLSLGLAAQLIAYRYEETYRIAHVSIDGPERAARRRLIRAGPVRIIARPQRWEMPVLVARRDSTRRTLGTATGPCITPSGCAGIDALQIRAGFVATRIRDHNRSYASGSVSVRAIDGGPARRDCSGRGYVGGFVLAVGGRLACAFDEHDPDHPRDSPPEIRRDGQVIARAAGIDVHSLHRRGDELVWLEDGAERTAPLP